MSSLFKQTTGISLSSVLGGNTSNNSSNTNSSSLTAKTNHSVKNVPNQTIQVKNFAEKIKLQQHQHALNTNNYLKTIDNCLEEASRTGELLLINKSLVEFPSTIALRYDLTDTLLVDLSKNRLQNLPKDILRYKPLEKLILNSNIIRTIPDIGLTQLRCLKTLDLNSNRLTYLPASVCNLVSLEILTVNNNKLVSLPEEIGHLEKLIQLDVSCNEITHLPQQIGDMVSMRALNVRKNLLVELPKEISQLKLVNFDCSSNRISKLPLCFRGMVTLIDLTVENNPLELPPAHVCTKGLLHIMKYLLVETIKEEKKRGVLLSDYEMNHQFSQLTTGNNNNNNNMDRRESCNSSTTGLGSIGSFIFQSSVKNMNKTYNADNISTQSTTASSSASTVSTSSSSASANSSNDPKTTSPKSRLTTLLAPADKKGEYQFLNEQTISKQNLFISSENANDFVDAPSMSSSSSPSSTTSSSPPATPVTGQSIVTTINKHVASIHDIISPNSLQTNSSKFQNSNFVSYTQTNEFMVDSEESPSQQIWRANEIASNKNFIKQKPIIKQMPSISSSNNSCNEKLYDLYSEQQTINQANNVFRRSSQSLKTPAKSSSLQHTTSTPKTFNQDTNQIVYDEFLNPIIVTSNQTNNRNSPLDPYQYQQQQMIWVPREDIKLAEPASTHTTTTYNPNQHKPQYQVSSQQQNVLTLPSGRELPSDLKSVDPAFTIRRHYIQTQQDSKQVETLRKIIDSKLNIQIPITTSTEELGNMLSDGVILCHLINQMFPRAVQVIIAPSINTPKLSISKCRKNIESFLEACHEVGLDEVEMCSVNDVLEGKNTSKVAKTIITLSNHFQYRQQQQQQQHLNNSQQYSQINQNFDHIRQPQQQHSSGTNACLTIQQQQQTAV